MTDFRDWPTIRDLGLAEAAHRDDWAYISRANDLGGWAGAHHHEMDFPIMFIVKGGVNMWYEDEGEFTLEASDHVCLAPHIVHGVLDYGDVEPLEFESPAEHATIDP